MSDISETLVANSDQIDAIDLRHSGPRTFTVERVVVNKSDQPVNVYLREIDRIFRPSKNMRRVLAEAWGPDSSQWTGRGMTLYCDPDVTFGRDKTGGVRISHLSHIDSTQRVPIIVSRGKTGLWNVDPLPEAPQQQQQQAVDGPTLEQIAATTDVNTLRGGLTRFPHRADAIQARLDELENGGA